MTFSWQINLPDLLAVAGAAAVLYSRLVSLETKVEPLWAWWNQRQRMEQEVRNHA